MKNFVGSWQVIIALFSGVTLALVVGFVLFGDITRADEEEDKPYLETKVDVVSAAEFIYPVAGEVQATQELTIRAKQTGVVEHVRVTEGSVVGSGELLAVQINPVLSAQLAAATAGAAARSLGEATNLAAKASADDIATAANYTASGYQALSQVADENALKAAREGAVALLVASEAALSHTFAFIDDEPSFFPAVALNNYRAVLTSWYGSVPDHLRVGLPTPTRTDALVLRMRQATTETDAIDLSILLGELIETTKSTAAVLTEAESEFLDSNKISRTDSRYVAYQNERAALASLIADLTSAKGALLSAYTGGLTNSLTAGQSTYEAERSAQNAALQKALGEELYAAVLSLGEAERAVVLAQIADGENRSPVDAVVNEVLVEEGEFVVAGKPLMTIVGSAEEEVVVTIPQSLRSLLAVGIPFVIEGETVGEVSRIAPKAEGGAVKVYITLTVLLPLGDIARGALSLPTELGELRQISRRELFFGQAGPYVMTTTGEKIEVSIVHDAGEWLLIDPISALDGDLVSAFGVRL